MGARGANKLAELAAELREQVPPQFLPKQDATLRSDFAVAELTALDAGTQDFSLEIDDTAPALSPEPTISEVVNDTDLDLEPEIVEPEVNVVDTPGASDIHEAALDVAAVHEEAGEDQRRRHFQAQDAVSDGRDIGGSINGYQAGLWANAQQNESAEKKREKENEKFTQAMLKKMLDDRIRWLDQQIAHWTKERDEWRGHADAFADAMERKQRGEDIALDADGYPTDPKLRAAVMAHERKYGVKLNVNDMQDLRTGNRAANDYADYSDQKVQDAQRQRNEAQRLKDDLERNPADPETRRRIEEKFGTAQGQEEVAQAAAMSADRNVKEVVHNAGATTVADRVIMQAQLRDSNLFTQSGGVVSENEDDLYATQGTSVAKNVDPLGFDQDPLRAGFAVAASGETAPAPEDDPAQRVAAVPASAPVRSA